MMYITIFLCSFILTYFIKEYAIKKSLVAEVNERSSHTTPTPHGGGIAIAVSWFVGLSYVWFQGEVATELYEALMVGVVLSFVSYLDDLFELSAKLRLIVQAFVALLGLYFLGGLENADILFFTLHNPFINTVLAFLFIVWCINLYNFLDGIDGYAGAEAVFLSLAGYLLFSGVHFLVLCMAVLGFLIWNWHKAKIFMGDVGSTLLGYNVAIFTLYYANQSSHNLWVWIVLFSLFFYDATLTLLRRYKNKESLTTAHKKHAYQRLTQAGFSHSKVVLWGMGVNILLFLIVFYTHNSLVILLFSLAIFYSLIRYIDNKKGFY